MKKPILLIPMCGIGQRFKTAGYKKHKSLIDILGKNMIEKLMDNFNSDVEIFIITSEKIYSQIKKEINPDIQFILIEDHKLGPAFTIYKAQKYIPPKRPIFISYCDIYWNWEKSIVNKVIDKSDAAIFTHSGFHPHLVKNSFSAFCKADDINSQLLEIKEKGSFTDNWMEEKLSIGVFYVKDINLLHDPLVTMVKKNQKVCDEFYPSLIFNFLIEKNIKVDLYDIDYFVHYGTPEQLEDFKDWMTFFSNNKYINQSHLDDNYSSIILAAGSGSRMKNLSVNPKPLIKLGKKSLIENVIEHLPLNKQKCTLILNEDIDKGSIKQLNMETIYIKQTNSQLGTIESILPKIESKNNFFICSCDCFGSFSSKKLKEMIKNKFDIICFGFEASLMQNKLGGHTYFEFKENLINNIFIKSKMNDSNLGLAGFFWIRKGSAVLKIIKSLILKEKLINRELIIDDLVKEALSMGYKVGHLRLNNYKHLGTTEEFKEFIYWRNSSKVLI